MLASIAESIYPSHALEAISRRKQVTQHCAERGRLLDRIWRSLNELFEYVLREMTETVDRFGRARPLFVF